MNRILLPIKDGRELIKLRSLRRRQLRRSTLQFLILYLLSGGFLLLAVLNRSIVMMILCAALSFWAAYYIGILFDQIRRDWRSIKALNQQIHEDKNH